MIHHLRQSHSDREQLAAKVRLLVGRSYKRAADRQWMRDQGFDVPDPKPGSWESFEDNVYRVYTPNLRVLDGGGEEVAAVGRRPPLEASSQAAVGRKPSVVVERAAAGAVHQLRDRGGSFDDPRNRQV